MCVKAHSGPLAMLPIIRGRQVRGTHYIMPVKVQNIYFMEMLMLLHRSSSRRTIRLVCRTGSDIGRCWTGPVVYGITLKCIITYLHSLMILCVIRSCPVPSATD